MPLTASSIASALAERGLDAKPDVLERCELSQPKSNCAAPQREQAPPLAAPPPVATHAGAPHRAVCVASLAGVLLASELRVDAEGLADQAEASAMAQKADSVTLKLLDSMRAAAVSFVVVSFRPPTWASRQGEVKGRGNFGVVPTVAANRNLLSAQSRPAPSTPPGAPVSALPRPAEPPCSPVPEAATRGAR